MALLLGYFGPETENRSWWETALGRFGALPDLKRLSLPGLEVVAQGQISQAGALVGRTLGGANLLDCLEQQGRAVLQSDKADGQYSLVWYDPTTAQLTLAHDPFGAERLFYARLGQTLWFSNQLRALLTLPAFAKKRELDLAALHSYLAFSFVAAPRTLIAGIQVVPPNKALIFDSPQAAPQSQDLLQLEPALAGAQLPERDEKGWAEQLKTELDGAFERHLSRTEEAAVHLSGGLDSALVAAQLGRAGVKTRLFHLDFGPPFNIEKPYAAETARFLEKPLESIPVWPDKKSGPEQLRQMVGQMGEPWGDPVTLPLYLGYRAVNEAGLGVVFNGEGGDQLFAGWPNRAMLTAGLYGATDQSASYLQTFHHFYGLENTLYGPELCQVAQETDLQTEIRPYLIEPALPDLLARLRWVNYWLKGSQNIMPRAAALARGAGLEMGTPLFDRRLARFALNIPGPFLMRDTQEKYLLKRVLEDQKLLPPEILYRPKRGMGVPATEWSSGPFSGEFKRLLGNLAKRDLFNKNYLKMLSKGQDTEGEIRKHRRLGEKIWQLVILEIWLELFLD